jgi:hypothetical protein
MLEKVLRRLRLSSFIFKEVRSEAFLVVLLAEVPAAVLAAVLAAFANASARNLQNDASW